MHAGGVKLTTVSLNSAIFAHATGGEWRRSVELLEQMPARFRVHPDVVSFGSAIQAVAAAAGANGANGAVVAGEAAEAVAEAAEALDVGFELLERTLAELPPSEASKTFVHHQVVLRACQAAGQHARAAALQRDMQARGLVSLATPLATTVDARSGAQREYRNGREPAALAARTRALCDAVAAGSAYATQHHALPYDFVQRCSAEQQQSSLRHHAEKKALADLLFGAGAAAGDAATAGDDAGAAAGGAADGAAGDELALAINIKVCADCHEFLKGASALLGRTIRVQEPGLLHTFVGGECSCRDEWRWEERARRRGRET